LIAPPGFCKDRWITAAVVDHADAVYHQGTVWPWLIGPFVEALLRVDRLVLAGRQRPDRAHPAEREWA